MAQDTYNTYAPLQTVTLAQSTGVVQFGISAASGSEADWIPQYYIDLIVVVQGTAVSGTGSPGLAVRFNADSGSNYGYSMMDAYNSATATSYRGSATTSIAVGWNGRYSATNWASARLQISNYASTAVHKHVLAEQAGASLGPSVSLGRWASTSAIKTIQFALGSTFPDDTWAVGSVFTLYGVGVRNRV